MKKTLLLLGALSLFSACNHHQEVSKENNAPSKIPEDSEPKQYSLLSDLHYLPGGETKIQVDISLENEKITSAYITEVPEKRRNRYYIYEVNQQIQQFVIGKKISEVTESFVVNGASITSDKFVEQLKKIEQER